MTHAEEISRLGGENAGAIADTAPAQLRAVAWALAAVLHQSPSVSRHQSQSGLRDTIVSVVLSSCSVLLIYVLWGFRFQLRYIG